jgi:hypothetical protein
MERRFNAAVAEALAVVDGGSDGLVGQSRLPLATRHDEAGD